MNIVISDTKAGKAYNKKTEGPVFLNKKIGDEVPLDVLGLSGFKAVISGGSDKQGFPMKKTFPGSARKKIMIAKGTGFNPKRKGERKRISVRGNLVSDETAQLNLAVTHYGSENLETILGKKSDAGEKAERESAEAKAEVKTETKKPGAKETEAEEPSKAEKPEKAEKPAEEKKEKAEEVKEKQEEKAPEEKKESKPKEEKRTDKTEDKA